MKKVISLFAFIVPFFMAGCDDDENNGSNIVYITENITSPTTWYASSVYVIESYDLWVTSTLTIEAGTVIKFRADGPGMSVGADGTIIANGTADKPIYFTSINDDKHGGDVNNNGTTTLPLNGDWNNIYVEGNGSSFKYCYFMYGGASNLSTLEIFNEMATIDHCFFLYNKGGKFGDSYFGVLDCTGAKNTTVITNNVFYGNILPLSVTTTIDIDNSNIFSNPDDATQTNSMNCIALYDLEGIIRAVQWEETEVPFLINDNDLWIESPGSLTLGNNVVVKFTPSSELTIGIGAQINQGTGNAFTSFKDDTRLGDSNGDEDATTPSDGDWGGIYNDDSSEYQTWSNIYYDSH